jgi:hypothetical protein
LRAALPRPSRRSLAVALVATAVAALGCTGADGPAGPTVCGSSGPVTGCTVLVMQPGQLGTSNRCQLAISAADGGTRIMLTTSGSSLTYPALDATVTLPAAPVAGNTYAASQLSTADVTVSLDPNQTWGADLGSASWAGDLSLHVDAYQPSGSAATLHGNLNALLVAQTAGGTLSICAVF